MSPQMRWSPDQPLRHDATSRDIDRRTAFINGMRATHPKWGQDPRPGRELALQEFAEAVQTFNEHGIQDTHLVIRESGAAGECWIVDREGQRFPIEMPKFRARYDAVNVLRTVLNEIMDAAYKARHPHLHAEGKRLADIPIVEDPSMPRGEAELRSDTDRVRAQFVPQGTETGTVRFLDEIEQCVLKDYGVTGAKELPRFPTPKEFSGRRKYLYLSLMARFGYMPKDKAPRRIIADARATVQKQLEAELQKSMRAAELSQMTEEEAIHAMSGRFTQSLRCGKCGTTIKRTDLTRHIGECPKRHESCLSTESVLAEADRVCNGDRQQDYGDFGPSWRKIARGWSLVLDTEVTPQQAVRCMQWLKIARNCFKPKRDNNVDLAAYAHIERSLDEVDEANR